MTSTLTKRLSVSAVLISITAGTIFFTPSWFFFIVVEAFSLLGLNEFLELARKKGVPVNRVMGLLFAAILPFFMVWQAEAALLAAATLCLFIYNFYRPLKEQALLNTAVTIFGIVYVSWFFCHFIKIRELAAGPQWVFFTILIVKGGDAGAYFVGKAIGRVKLLEHISPNKSVEGAVACLITTLLLALLSKAYLGDVPFRDLAILGFLAGIISQLGDLAESLIKRDAGVKDSGHIPGLGGILDVLDSLIFTAPVIYYYRVMVLGV